MINKDKIIEIFVSIGKTAQVDHRKPEYIDHLKTIDLRGLS